MALWLTYSWLDNQNGDIDYLVSELRKADVAVNIDRVVIGAGSPHLGSDQQPNF
jgi:hypothetical protein